MLCFVVDYYNLPSLTIPSLTILLQGAEIVSKPKFIASL